MKIDLRFSHNYKIENLEELPTGRKVYYYPGASIHGGKNGLLFGVSPMHFDSWIGVFAYGEVSSKGLSAVYALPDPDKFCVVSKGAGYIVSAADPTNWSNVKLIPIMNAHPATSHGIVLFANYTELIAYNSFGVIWETERLAFDGFRILEETGDLLKGEYYDIRSESMETFEVNLLTGKRIGGKKKIW